MPPKRKSFGVGMIGCGGRATGLAHMIRQVDPRIEFRCASDPSAVSIANARAMLNPELRVHEDYRALVRDPEIDWVLIGSWNAYHREHAVAALRAGKHVFCEKPLATTLTDAVAMRREWLKTDRQFAIGFTLRYSPHYVRIHELIRKGEIGDLVSIEFNETLDWNHGGYIHADWRRLREHAGTHLLEKCCHDIDLINWMVGSAAERVASFGGTDFFTPANRKHQRRLGRGPDGQMPYQAWPMPDRRNPFTADKDIVDNQVAIIEFANGVRATFHTNCNAGIPERRMYILGTTGAIRADLWTSRVELRKIGWDAAMEDRSIGQEVDGHGGGDNVLSEEVAAAITRGRKLRAGLDDGLRSAVTCFAIDRACDTGRVVDLEAMWRKTGLMNGKAK